MPGSDAKARGGSLTWLASGGFSARDERATDMKGPNQAVVVPRKARDDGIGVTPLEIRHYYPVGASAVLINPTRPKTSHQVGSRTEVRSSRDGVRSRGEARTQAAELSSEKCIVVVNG